jgi:nucleotide-binding universal stress UspA family protein
MASTLPDAVGQTAVVLGSPDEVLASFCHEEQAELLASFCHEEQAELLASFCHEEQAELLVVGSRDRGRLAAELLGSHVSAGSCPVVVVPPAAGARFLAPARPGGSVVCGIDGSVEAVRAVRVGANVASRLGLEFVPVYSISATRGMGRRPPTRSCSTSKPVILSRGSTGAP